MNQQTLIAKVHEHYKGRMSADPRGAQARRIYDAVMAQHRQRMADSKPPERHIHVVAHAGSGQQTQFKYATNELIAQVQAERHAREQAEAQAREREQAQADIMAQFTSRKPAALAIRAIKE